MTPSGPLSCLTVPLTAVRFSGAVFNPVAVRGAPDRGFHRLRGMSSASVTVTRRHAGFPVPSAVPLSRPPGPRPPSGPVCAAPRLLEQVQRPLVHRWVISGAGLRPEQAQRGQQVLGPPQPALQRSRGHNRHAACRDPTPGSGPHCLIPAFTRADRRAGLAFSDQQGSPAASHPLNCDAPTRHPVCRPARTRPIPPPPVFCRPLQTPSPPTKLAWAQSVPDSGSFGKPPNSSGASTVGGLSN